MNVWDAMTRDTARWSAEASRPGNYRGMAVGYRGDHAGAVGRVSMWDYVATMGPSGLVILSAVARNRGVLGAAGRSRRVSLAETAGVRWTAFADMRDAA